MQSNVGVRLRVRYTKLGKVRFVSHRDGARLWERALRRVSVPVAYTEGFTPRPKIGFGLALPTAAESIAEYVDLDLSRDAAVDPSSAEWDAWLGDLTAGLSEALPVGMDALATVERESGDGSLQERVTSTTWELTGLGLEPDELDTALQRVLAADELLVERERKGQRRTDDVRPLIRDLRVAERTVVDGVDRRVDIAVEPAVVADLVTIGRALRPSELAGLIRPGIDGLSVRVLRTHQWIDHDGERRDVIPLERPITRTNDHDRREPDVRQPPARVIEERRGTARTYAGGQAQ